MADPKLVAYLRKTVPQYGADPVREKLIEEGVSEAEIDEALAVAIKPPAKRKTPLLIYGGFTLFAVGAAVMLFSMDKGKPAEKKPAMAAMPSLDPDAPTDTAAPQPQPEAATQPPQTEALKGPFIGHYGYMLQAPPGYATMRQFKELGNRTEVVFLFPEKTDPTNFVNEGLYGPLGILRMEVSPLKIPQGTIGLDSLKGGITKTLNARGDTYTVSETKVGNLSGFIVNISAPFPLAQAFVVGTKVLYVLTGGVDDPVFRNTLLSLTEVSPHDKPVE